MPVANIEYYRCEQGITLETDSNGVQHVRRGNDEVELNAAQVRTVDILLRMPDSTADEIQSSLVMMTGRPVSKSEVQSMLGQLSQKSCVIRQVCAPRLTMPYPIDHTCELCGCSCMAQLVGPLTESEHDNAVEAHRKLSESGDMPADLNPIMKGLKPDGTCMHFIHFPGKRCAFLGDDNLCRIHGRFGAEKKPAACRRFPVIAIATESEIRIGIKPYCYANMRTCSLSHTQPGYLESYRSAHADAFADLVENASFRAVLRTPDEDELLQARLQEAQILSWLDQPMPYAAILASLISGAPSGLAQLPKPFVQDVQRAFGGLSEMLAEDVKKLGDTKHAAHAADLLACLKRPLVQFDSLRPESPFGRYVRFAIYEAVFLRETTRFPAVSLGAFAYALGALAAAQDPDRADAHFTAWMRLMAQTQAFTMLFPSPQAMAALTRHLM